MVRRNPPPGSLPLSFCGVAQDLLCPMSHRQGITHPDFDDPVGNLGTGYHTRWGGLKPHLLQQFNFISIPGIAYTIAVHEFNDYYALDINTSNPTM